MLRKSFYWYGIAVTLIVIFLMLAIKQLMLSESIALKQSQADSHATTVAQINLMLSEESLLQQAAELRYEQLASSLSALDSIAGWRLKDADNQFIAGDEALQQPDLALFYFYIPYGQAFELATLEVFLPMPQQSLALTFVELVLAGGAILLILAGLGLLFRHLVDLEKYATYLLTNEIRPSHGGTAKLEGPIHKVINQLLLKNAKLKRDTEVLTDQIRRTSYIDPITELGNHRFFKAEFQVRLHNKGEPESGLFLLVSFPQDEITPLVSSDNLPEIAQVIQSFTCDIPNSLVARLHGNDFALLLPNQIRGETDKLCRSLIMQLENRVFNKLSTESSYISIGISAYKQGFDYYKVLAEADMALRNAQLQGGNSWYMFGESLPDSSIRGHLRWRNFLQRILDKRQLVLYCQKFHYFTDQSFNHSEILVRASDGGKDINADTFVPMAQAVGLAREFDQFIISQLRDHFSQQHANRMDQSNHKFSLNVFVENLFDEKFVSWLSELLADNPDFARALSIEITEANIMRYRGRLREPMAMLSPLGVKFCVEHFGSPDADLSYLAYLPIDSVKVDRRIVFEIHKSNAQQLLLKTLIINARSHQLSIFAEGVESFEDARYIESTKIDGAQGFFLSEVLPLDNNRLSLLKAG